MDLSAILDEVRFGKYGVCKFIVDQNQRVAPKTP